MVATLDAVLETGAAGGLVWSLRYRNRDGGFYWHSEPAGGDKYKAYHWPGFPSGADYDELSFLRLMQQKAFAIRGLAVPPSPPPAPPRLLPITGAAAMSWQGSVDATDYQVERASRRAGPWTGPVQVRQAMLADEMADFSLIQERRGALEIMTRDCRKAKEDAHRLAGKPDSAIVYRLNGPIRAVRLYAFFPGTVADFRFSASREGQNYHEIQVDKTVYLNNAGDYGYWKGAFYYSQRLSGSDQFIRIEFGTEAQISRIEIDHQK
jgi:hypothetical protein